MPLSKYLKETHQTLQGISDEYIKASNSEYSELTKHIGMFSSILLPLVGLFITSERYVEISTKETNIAAVAIVISLCLCLVLGFASYILNGEFFLKLSKEIADAQDKIATTATKTDADEVELVDSIYADLTTDSNFSGVLVWVAAVFLFIAIVSFVYLMQQILFTATSDHVVPVSVEELDEDLGSNNVATTTDMDAEVSSEETR